MVKYGSSPVTVAGPSAVSTTPASPLITLARRKPSATRRRRRLIGASYQPRPAGQQPLGRRPGGPAAAARTAPAVGPTGGAGPYRPSPSEQFRPRRSGGVAAALPVVSAPVRHLRSP